MYYKALNPTVFWTPSQALAPQHNSDSSGHTIQP